MNVLVACWVNPDSLFQLKSYFEYKGKDTRQYLNITYSKGNKMNCTKRKNINRRRKTIFFWNEFKSTHKPSKVTMFAYINNILCVCVSVCKNGQKSITGLFPRVIQLLSHENGNDSIETNTTIMPIAYLTYSGEKMLGESILICKCRRWTYICPVMTISIKSSKLYLFDRFQSFLCGFCFVLFWQISILIQEAYFSLTS